MNDLHAADEGEREALAELLPHAFGFPPDDTMKWFERVGFENIRAYREEGALAGGLMLAPMGQFFGGRSVPMTGVLGVATAPEHRGRGAATRMMRATVRELRARGVALSTLYPATVPLYQRAGYERAGARYAVAVRPQDLPTAHDGALRFVRLASVGDGATRELQRRFARTRDGALDRGPYVWARVNGPFRASARCHGVEGPDGLEGYVVVWHRMSDGHDTELTALDMAAATPRAAQAVLAFLGGYRSLAREVRWHGAPHDVFAQTLRDRHHAISLADFWMLRLVDVPGALAARGYARALRASLTLTVTDDVVPENAGSWRLDVAGGEGAVARADRGDLAIDVRALAPLYSGFRSATALAEAGLAAGAPEALEAADALFAGPSPTMGEMF